MADPPSSASVAGSSKDEGGILNVREIGFTQIDRHPKNHPFIADIIFIHGLQGHPRRTWQSRSSAKTRKRILDRFKILAHLTKDGETHADGRTFWPADLLPKDFKSIRVLTFGYDSMVTKSLTGLTSKNGIFEHGRSFLRALSRARVHCGDRPVIFVAHSLG